VCMDFDHVRGKKRYSISIMVAWAMLIDDIMDELKKCELVCSNCHRIRTESRR
jgi:hypothetical protein